VFEPLKMREGLAQMLQAFEGVTIEHVLLTTFNFDPGFFERNVLPLLCGFTIDDIKQRSTEALANDMYTPLKRTQVVVAYDQSVLTGVPTGNLRYALLPRHVSDAFFHAKIMVLLGKDETGKAKGAIMVGSGNMTLSGWAKNVEVAGWSFLNKRNAQELVGFYQYLKAPNELDMASTLLRGIVDEQNRPELFLQYPTKGDRNLFDRIFPKDPPKEMHVYSPYWSKSAVELFPSATKLTCYPAKESNSFKFPIEQSQVNAADSRISVMAIAGEERFCHAKAYIWDDGVAIGSANCTMQALHDQGNVEAMLRYDGIGPIEQGSVKLDDWQVDTDLEESIKPLPFAVIVIADYNDRIYEVTVSVEKKTRCARWKLHFGEQNLHADDSVVARLINFTPNKPIAKFFTIQWESTESGIQTSTHTLTGIVIPRGGNDVELGYRPRRDLARIFDDMLRHRPVGSVTYERPEGHVSDDGRSFSADDVSDDSDTIEQDFEFDMYGMYQSFFHLRKELQKVNSNPGRESKVEEISDTLIEIFEAVKNREVENDLQRWLILQECMDLVKELATLDNSGKNSLLFEKFKPYSTLAEDLDKATKKMLIGDRVLRDYGIESDSLIRWLRVELGYA